MRKGEFGQGLLESWTVSFNQPSSLVMTISFRIPNRLGKVRSTTAEARSICVEGEMERLVVPKGVAAPWRARGFTGQARSIPSLFCFTSPSNLRSTSAKSSNPVQLDTRSSKKHGSLISLPPNKQATSFIPPTTSRSPSPFPFPPLSLSSFFFFFCGWLHIF